MGRRGISLLHFPASPVLLLSSRPRMCYHYICPWDFALWSIIHRSLVGSFSYVFFLSYSLMLFPE
jgi:hypothetical protein